LFFDVGGVLATNGWDHGARRRAAEEFHLEWEEFEARHQQVEANFDLGRVSLADYLECAVFYRPRTFSREAFREFMYAQSQPDSESLALVAEIASGGRYLLATLNNESVELNRYRIDLFGLRRWFTVFFSSCYLGVRKPDEKIYRLAIDLTQRDPAECVLIDDRALNVESAERAGLAAIRFESAAQLRAELSRRGLI
jgi:putative hydrolase of the HAD superfamily